MKPLASTTRSPRRTAAIGVVAATLTVGATGAAYALAQEAVAPDTAVVAGDQPVEVVADPPAEVVADEPPAPAPAQDHAPVPPPVPGEEEYTQERADAFWGAGYVMEDADALAELWDVPLLEAKGRAGQLLLDGQPVPIAPGSSLDLTDPETIDRLGYVAYWDAGYTHEDGEKLAALWEVDVYEAKVTAGRMLFAGQTLPVPPSGTPAS
ncbi:hypothetical protein [Cellulomonas fimi]|uniref:Uncharacterized protein n=1 Tax=Cellulomonas fimi (strain ATCC 484 / DSM 20113 / JCM 1341 / CCUG 24087 / LMG 16345 / NBRC 15513 / NCIMB 8980 / NCTC 7547 / NRS-133) TaxID=590998 RepID=F4H2T6_CELFA|nr:hypothetical protein [Cellulomonas fimi]AEE46435.1 hypothetical protein Celf_2308 [Cellulomonas fimi ATCC 484]NNH07727.1 hypothetical protein [Cellulomonas fimi]VEH32987.1 Uncharacterised protein [Cellulomonas fimi]